MAINAEKLSALQADFKSLRNESCNDFRCPITLREFPSSDLINGHILNEAIKSEFDKSTGKQKTVIQSGVVDNYFGTTIEPEFINFLNVPISSTGESFAGKGNVGATVSGKSGKNYEVFYAKSKSFDGLRKLYPQIRLTDNTSGKFVGDPFVRAPFDEFADGDQVVINTKFQISHPAIIGSFIKAAYLSLFELMGYHFVYSPAGDYLRGPLEQFFVQQGTKDNAWSFFSQFRGACNIFQNDTAVWTCDTPNDRWVLFHYVDMVFAISCLFILNGKTYTVTVPIRMPGEDWSVAMQRYAELLKNKNMVQTVMPAVYQDGGWTLMANPLHIRCPK